MIVVVNISKSQTYDLLESVAPVTYVSDIRTEEQLVQVCVDAEAIVLNAINMSAEALMQLPKLNVVAICGTGFDHVDVVKARELGVTVCNAPGYGAQAVAQHTVALIFELCNNVGQYNSCVKTHGWKTSESSPERRSTFDLQGKTVGLFGFGSIGKRVATMLTAFGVKILVYNRSEYKMPSLDIDYVSLEELFKRSDMVSLHMRLNDETEGMIDHHYLSLMKENAFLINTARGGLIKEPDLISGLKMGKPVAAALDVTAVEPLPDDSELRCMPNCIITPHVAWNSPESLQRLADITAQNISTFYQGNPQHVVN